MEAVTSLIKALGTLSLTKKSSTDVNQNDTEYVLDLAVQNCPDPLIAAVYSNFSIQLLSKKVMAETSVIAGHKDTVTKVQFGKTDSHLVYSCSKDKTVRCWDPRVTTCKEVHVFQALPTVDAEFLSLDISHSDRLICAGTENIGGDSYLLFWDNRQNSLLGCYSECHRDDITQVCFQPGSDRYLASGSADGLVCTFDLTETTEDDALLITSNAESDVARVGWCGQNCVDSIYCVTSDNTFHVWDALQGDSCCTINNLCSKQNVVVDYIVDCIPELTANHDKSSAVLLTGSYSGNLHLLQLTNQSSDSQVLSTLTEGHTSAVRCCHWDSKTQTLLTGGEDSLVCLWSTDQSLQFSSTSHKAGSQGKIKGKISVSEHAKKPYSKT